MLRLFFVLYYIYGRVHAIPTYRVYRLYDTCTSIIDKDITLSIHSLLALRLIIRSMMSTLITRWTHMIPQGIPCPLSSCGKCGIHIHISVMIAAKPYLEHHRWHHPIIYCHSDDSCRIYAYYNHRSMYIVKSPATIFNLSFHLYKHNSK